MSNNYPTVFLPGTLCDERLWMKVWEKIQITDRRYVPLQWAETMQQMAGLTDYAVANDKVNLVGFSMGGLIAAQYAISHPANVASLTLIGYSSFGLEHTEIKQRQGLIKTLQKGQYRPMSDQRLAIFVSPEGANAPYANKVVREMESDLGASVLKYQLNATSQRQDLTTKLAGTEFNINIIAAEQDCIAPLSILKKMHQKIAHSQFHSIKNSGHFLPLERPEALAERLTNLIGVE